MRLDVDIDRPILVVALGGNALQAPEGDDSVAADFATTATTADHLARLIASGRWRIVVTHGNGPQVGNHLLRSELGEREGSLPGLPLEVCVADTQGGMGYMLQQCLTNALHEHDVPAVVASVVTQVVVDPHDPAFETPTKPVGEPIPEDRVEFLRASGWHISEDERGRRRRVVPSPEPGEIVEGDAVRALVDRGVTVIAGGGGGIPVAQDEAGRLRGVHAVVDKDLVAALLARDLGAEGLLILTDVDAVRLDYGTEAETVVRRMTVHEARSYLDRGHFPPGSMGPKVEAVCRFVEGGGSLAVIASIADSERAAAGEAGTRVVRKDA